MPAMQATERVGQVVSPPQIIGSDLNEEGSRGALGPFGRWARGAAA